MQDEPKWSNNKILLVELAQNFKLLQEQNKVLRKQIEGKTKLKQPQSLPNKSKSDSEQYSRDQQKILKLYSYKNWKQFMSWIDEKLEESGQTISGGDEDNNSDKDDSEIKRVLSQILEQPDFEESYTLDRTEEKNQKNKGDSQSQVQLLAIENGKLRRQNIQLKSIVYKKFPNLKAHSQTIFLI